jgi:hypothetical protein
VIATGTIVTITGSTTITITGITTGVVAIRREHVTQNQTMHCPGGASLIHFSCQPAYGAVAEREA